MPFDAPRLIACAAALGLGASPLAGARVSYLEMSVCGMAGKTAHIPIPGKRAPRPDCPTGCHALMSRKCGEHEDSD